MKEENEGTKSEMTQKDESANTDREEVYTKIVRAGNRTYFFDIKATRKNDLYLTITESKKRFNKEGKFFFEKHKIFLYKEDFEKFVNGLDDAIGFVNNGSFEEGVTPSKKEPVDEEKSTSTDEFINVEFEDLGDK
ncbi:MAG TPA: DUF3276 family protein [Bacteroidales bacterium]|nr:DUF3276 family protein [Bacteroidales bacterium]